MKRLSGFFGSKKPALDRRAPVTDKILGDLETQAKTADLGLRWVPLNRAGDLCDRGGDRARALQYYGRAIDAMLEDGQPEPARGLATKIVRIHPEAVKTLCTLTWLDLAAHHMASVVVHLNEYVASALRGGREDIAGEQIHMMAHVVPDAEFRGAAADALDALEFTDFAAEVRVWIEAGLTPYDEGGPGDWTELCLSHALGSNVRKIIVTGQDRSDPGDARGSRASGAKQANGEEASEGDAEGGEEVQTTRDSKANGHDQAEGYPA
jgi:hypothetical protein